MAALIAAALLIAGILGLTEYASLVTVSIIAIVAGVLLIAEVALPRLRRTP